MGITARFPNLPEYPKPAPDGAFKIIEVRDDSIDQHIPTCAYADAYPKGFFPEDQDSYRSKVVIDDIRGLFIRPDGSFWLKLSDENWYRFRRDMTSDASEIRSKYHVVSEAAFNAAVSKSKNFKQLDDLLIEMTKLHTNSH